MKVILSIAVAGAIGALLRYGVVSLVGVRFFPFGTLAVNVLGSGLMGVAYVVIVEKMLTHPDMRHLVMTGALGAFTTFSAFSLEVWSLIDKGAFSLAALYIIVSVLLSVAALWLAISCTRLAIA